MSEKSNSSRIICILKVLSCYVQTFFRYWLQEGCQGLCSKILLWIISDRPWWNCHPGRCLRRSSGFYSWKVARGDYFYPLFILICPIFSQTIICVVTTKQCKEISLNIAFKRRKFKKPSNESSQVDWGREMWRMHSIIDEVKNPGGFPHKGLYREDLPEGGTFFRLKGKDSQVEVYERGG